MPLNDSDWIAAAQVYATTAALYARLAASFGPQGGDLWFVYRAQALDAQAKSKQALTNAGVTL